MYVFAWQIHSTVDQEELIMMYVNHAQTFKKDSKKRKEAQLKKMYVTHPTELGAGRHYKGDLIYM